MPDPALYRVHLGEGPAGHFPYPDFNTDPIIVYWFGPARRDNELLHEIGHVTQRCYIRDEEMGPFERLLGGPQHRPIWWPPGSDPMARRRFDPFCEPFADAFMWMQTACPIWPRWRRSEFRRLLRPFIERGPLP
jgi:hypothetical protein